MVKISGAKATQVPQPKHLLWSMASVWLVFDISEEDY